MGRWEDGFKAGWSAALGYESVSSSSMPNPAVVERAKKARVKPTRTGKKNPALSRAMKKAYARSHKKNGEFRKGWDRSRMLKYAHKIK